MKKILLSILGISLITSCNDNKQLRTDEKPKSTEKKIVVHKISEELFLYHLKILDSVAKIPPPDTMYHCCRNSVNFMEEHTGIDADVEGDYVGATGFKKEDLRKWHEWYVKEYGHKNE